MEQSASPISPIVDRSVRLFHFLRELVAARLASVRDFSEYEDVIWLSEIPHESGWFCSCWNVDASEREQIGDDVWLRATKPKIKAPPKLTEKLKQWVNDGEVEDFRREIPPSLLTEIFETVKEKNEDGEIVERVVLHRLGEHPEIKDAHTEWIETYWLPWAEETRKLQPVQEIYGKLFALYQKQKRLGESFEIVIGLGLFTWKPEGQSPLKRHIITAQTELSFEGGRGILTVSPAADGARLTLEQDMLDVAKRPENDREVVEQLKLVADRWWDQNQIEPILRGWTNFFSSDGEYFHSLDRQAGGAEKPLVYFAPALILRKRTARTLIHVFESIVEQLKDGDADSVPIGVRSVVDTLEVDKGDSSDDDSSSNTVSQGDTEIYFPLAYNEQQKRIVDKFNSNHGVVVQGPPGTGKSQTIANLICHLLASGKRILITSQTARALQSLSEKVPEEVQALCVSLLGNDRKAYEGLEESIVGITNRYNSWDKSVNQRTIENLRKQLHEARMAQARLQADLRTLREAEVVEHQAPTGDYKGKLSGIARRLAIETDKFGWISEYATSNNIDLSDAEIGELLHLVKREEELVVRGSVLIPFELSALSTTEQFADMVDAEERSQSAAATLKELKGKKEFEKLKTLEPAKFHAIATGVRQIRSRLSKGKSHIHRWAEQVFVEVLGEKDRAWRILLQQTDAVLEKLRTSSQVVDTCRVALPLDYNTTKVLADCGILVKHLEDGGKLKGLLGKPKVVKERAYLIDQVSLDGKNITSLDEAKRLLCWLEAKQELETLQNLWDRICKVSFSTFAGTIAEFEDLSEPLREATALHSEMTSLRDQLVELGEIEIPVWYDLGSLDDFCRILEAIERSQKHEQSSLKVLEISRTLTRAYEGKLRPAQIDRLLSAIDKRNLSEYRICFFEIADLITASKELKRLRLLEESLRSISPNLLDKIKSSCNEAVWNDRLIEFQKAWQWSVVDRWMRRLSDPKASEKISREIEETRRNINRIIADLTVCLSWGHFFDRLTENERQNLIAWARNMQKIGKGTGKYVGKHRDAARNNMEQCRSAIPAWVMPIYRVAETLEPRPHSFDVVIIDEASQSGPEALFLEFIADKIIVVGDNKQISPESVGIDKEEVHQLRRKYLADLPHRDNIGVDDSFFDLALIRFPGFIRLREHFRCMPEIIQFSNNLFYAGEPMEPLKQYTANRLPPVVPCYVDGAYSEGSRKSSNPAEAEQIVQQVKKCVDDPRYAGKSIGVISLLSTSSQSHEIERRLLDAIGPDEMEKRNIVCGNPYDFQGDERDIIFLSMVAAPRDASRLATLTSERYARPYNVAASRAREQMWLFHSVQLKDLSPDCYRYKLIEYCYNPRVEPGTFDHTKVYSDVRIEPFDSLFEQRVFLKIVEKGYRVIPQLKVAGFNIDLVVEGMQGRLAVECDGDHWHGAEHFENDMVRQRQLERCGWTFWRIRESSYYRDTEQAMSGLWAALDRLKIYPDGRNKSSSDVQAVNHSSIAPTISNLQISHTVDAEVVEIQHANSTFE
jgi:very-short-patch-repair endonuclease